VTNYLKIGMPESQVFQLLGMPIQKSTVLDEYMLTFEVYSPPYDFSQLFFVCVNRFGYVTSFNSGGGGGGNSIDINVLHY